jgi:hypothetical protein
MGDGVDAETGVGVDAATGDGVGGETGVGVDAATGDGVDANTDPPPLEL